MTHNEISHDGEGAAPWGTCPACASDFYLDSFKLCKEQICLELALANKSRSESFDRNVALHKEIEALKSQAVEREKTNQQLSTTLVEQENEIARRDKIIEEAVVDSEYKCKRIDEESQNYVEMLELRDIALREKQKETNRADLAEKRLAVAMEAIDYYGKNSYGCDTCKLESCGTGDSWCGGAKAKEALYKIRAMDNQDANKCDDGSRMDGN